MGNRNTSHPFEIIANKPFVGVRINGSKPARFMLGHRVRRGVDRFPSPALSVFRRTGERGNFGVGWEVVPTPQTDGMSGVG